MAREITRAEVADIFYHDGKLRKLYGGRVPSGLNMSDVRQRLRTHTKTGKRRQRVLKEGTDGLNR